MKKFRMKSGHLEILFLIAFVYFTNSNQAIPQIMQRTPFSKLTHDQYLKLTLEDIKIIANQGDSDAQLQLGVLYCAGTNMAHPDIQEGITWYKKSIENGNGRAALYLAEIYQHGIEGHPDMKEAMKWFWKASDLGDDVATTWLAKWYKEGTNGVNQDYATALKLFQKLVDHGNRGGTVSLAEMYVKGDGVEKNSTKARELLKNFPDDGNADVSRILVELAGYESVNAIGSYLAKDKPTIPSFYFWRRAYQKKGPSYYKLFKSDENGVSSEEKAFTITHEEATEEYQTKHPVQAAFASYADMVKYSTPTATPTPIISPSKKWLITMPEGSWEDDHSIQLLNSDSNQQTEVDIPGGGWSWSPVCWNPTRDLFYFSENEGSSTDRHNDYWQFDPVMKKFTFIGGGIGSFEFSPDGKWIIWNDGTWIQWEDHQIHAYSVETNMDYTLTNGHSDNSFYKWADDNSIGKWDEINKHINAGRKLYSQKDFKGAISEYLKAIDLDPNNGTAYGYMGYSYLRNGQLDEAEKSLQNAMRLNPGDPMNKYNSSLVYWTKQNGGLASFWLEQLYIIDYSFRRKVEKDPQFKDVIKSPEYLKMIKKRWGRSKSS